MFKLFLAIISLIMQVAPPSEQFLIRHTGVSISFSIVGLTKIEGG